MATLKNKISLQVKSQLPDFVQSENPNFIAFMKAYYEFMESAELQLTSLGSVDSVLLEAQPVGAAATYSNFVLLQNPSEYRQEINSILLEDTSAGAFVNGEIITGTVSRATATIGVEDIQAGSRLFISSQSSFIIGETITGATSNATGVISNYTANPVQNIQQLMEYADVDDTVDQFFNEFKEAFLKTIPKKLTAGVNERNLLKNIKDLYRSKGTRKGHELFFRILLNEDPILYYPKQDMLRVSDGNWSEDSILRVSLGDDTFLMEDASATTGDIFILNENGGQIKTEDSAIGTSDLLKLVGQEITQAAVTDRSIVAGGAYDTTTQAARGLAPYTTIAQATALIDSISSYFYLGEQIFELVLSTGSTLGTFASGHTITATANDDDDVTLYAKLVSIVAEYDVTNSISSQYYDITDPLTITASNGNSASVKIDSLTSGDINSIIVDAGGSGYEIGDTVTVNNSSTNGTALAAQVSVVNGGISPEAGDLVGEWGIELETATPGAPGDIELETASGPGLLKQQEAYDMTVVDHIVLENYTVFNDGVAGDKIVQESGSGDVTDIVITTSGVGYTKTPLLTLPVTGSRTGATIYAKGIGVGKIKDVTILDAGAHYTDPLFPNLSRMGTLGYKVQIDATTNFLYTDISGNFLLNETVTGGTSGATGIYKSTDATRNVIKLANVVGTFQAGPEKSGETITGGTSLQTAIIDSYSIVSLKGDDGVLGETSGRFINEDGFLDEKTKKIQDSYYYQDYSYVVKTGSSINTWRDSILASVHPAGWALFGQVDISTAVQAIANITSITGLGPLYKIIYTMLLGRRLGTTDQLPINPFPAVGIHDPANYGNSFRITGSSKTINKGELITGDNSGATATAILDTTNDHGVNLLYYEFLAGGNAPGLAGSVYFEVGESCTASGGGVFTIVNIHGLQGVRDVTLFRYVKILTPPKYMTGDKYGFHPRLGDADEWKFSYGMVSSAASSRTFNSMAVYPVYLNMMTTITSAINNIVAIIPVAATDNLPTEGTIKLGSEEITYTGRSTASGAGNLTGATRGTNGTTAASHLINTNLTLVRLAATQSTASGYRLSDWATDWRGVALTIGDIGTYPQRKNNISAPTEITIWKT
jgi:hypothetical protein